MIKFDSYEITCKSLKMSCIFTSHKKRLRKKDSCCIYGEDVLPSESKEIKKTNLLFIGGTLLGEDEQILIPIDPNLEEEEINSVLQSYITQESGLSGPYTCTVCGHTGQLKSNLKRHLLRKHTKVDQKLSCPLLCGKTFRNKHSLVNHIGKTCRKSQII